MADKYTAFRIFLRVADLLSFTRAAESLSLPKATVSTTVQELEGTLGVRLFHRTTRQVRLTPEGTTFVERCRSLLADLDEAETMFHHGSALLQGKIRVDMAVTNARDVVIPRLPEFVAKHPGVEFEFSATDYRIDLAREGIDCVVRAGGASEPGLIEKDLGTLVLINCASPAYLKKYGTPKRLEDLKGHLLVNFTHRFGNPSDGFEYFDGERYREWKMRRSISVNNTDTYKAACLAGMGIAQIPLVGVRQHLQQGALVEVLPKHRAEPLAMKLVYHQRRLLTKRVRVFMDWLEPVLREHIAGKASPG